MNLKVLFLTPAIGAVFFSPNLLLAAVHLNVGESYTLEFNGLPLVGFNSERVGQQGFHREIIFGPDVITYPERVHVDFYEDFAGGMFWVKSSIGSLPGQSRSSSSGGTYWNLADNGPYDDLQGVIHFWMESGSVDLESIRFQVVNDGYVYERTFFLPVPEPPAFALVGISIIALIMFRKPQTRSGRRAVSP